MKKTHETQTAAINEKKGVAHSNDIPIEHDVKRHHGWLANEDVLKPMAGADAPAEKTEEREKHAHDKTAESEAKKPLKAPARQKNAETPNKLSRIRREELTR